MYFVLWTVLYYDSNIKEKFHLSEGKFCKMKVKFKTTFCRRLLHAMHQAKMEEAIQQAKALQKAMQTGQMATMVGF